MSRYAYFKKLTYFSTECIYSPDGTSMVSVACSLFLVVRKAGTTGYRLWRCGRRHNNI